MKDFRANLTKFAKYRICLEMTKKSLKPMQFLRICDEQDEQHNRKRVIKKTTEY